MICLLPTVLLNPSTRFLPNRNAYNLVLHKHAEMLYDGVQHSVTEHLHQIASGVASTPDEQLLAEISRCWGDHQITMNMVRDILMYMVSE